MKFYFSNSSAHGFQAPVTALFQYRITLEKVVVACYIIKGV